MRAGGGAMRKRTGLPSTATRSPNEMRWPVCAGSSLTVIRPSAIRSSMSRREPMPAWASTLCSFGRVGLGRQDPPAAWLGSPSAGSTTSLVELP